VKLGKKVSQSTNYIAHSITYRIRQVPLEINKVNLAEFLGRLSPSLLPIQHIRVHSIAKCISPWEKSSYTATVTFERLPPLLVGGTEWVLSALHLGHEQDIIIDSHFAGFTPLNEPDEGKYVFE
jgi:hypothetical protein